MVLVDDSHATGFMGKTGRGTPEHCGVARPRRHRHHDARQGARRRVGRLPSSARQEIVDLLRQRSRPYLFSNTLAAGRGRRARCAALDLLRASTALRDRLEKNTLRLPRAHDRGRLRDPPGRPPDRADHVLALRPDDAPLAQKFARALLDEGIYVMGFFFPVVPRGQSRIRVQLSAAHTPEHVDRAVAAFTKVGTRAGRAAK